MRLSFLFHFVEEQANPSSEDPITNSPTNGNKNKVVSGSTPSNDPWPSQADEDIDRLVAMHQNRHNSLSSLGVSTW